MKPIRRNKQFEKHFRKRLSPIPKLLQQFESQLNLFIAGVRDYPIHDHGLTGKMNGKRAFSVANDVRVIYVEKVDRITEK